MSNGIEDWGSLERREPAVTVKDRCATACRGERVLAKQHCNHAITLTPNTSARPQRSCLSFSLLLLLPAVSTSKPQPGILHLFLHVI